MANAKRKVYAKKMYIVENDKFVGVRFNFTNGHSLECRVVDLPPAVAAQATCHGLHQKVGDSYNQAESADEAERTANDTWVQLCEIGWKSGERGFAINLDDLARAYCEVKGGSLLDTKATLAGAEKEKVKELANVPKLKALMARYRLERLESAAEEADAVEIELP